MPLDVAVPTWYNDDSYINEKVDECNTIKFGAVEGEEFVPWTAASVRDFLAAANGQASYAPWMGYDNFVSNGNAENCSPNPLFNVMQYVTAKANQLNSINYDGRNADNNPWTAQDVLDYFNAHHITAWDHFTTAGQFEDVNPSNAMDLSDFLANKAKECNDIEFDGRNDWDDKAVLDYYQQHGLNAVMVAVNASDPNVVAVPQDDQVTPPVGFTPWGVAATPVDVELTTGVDVMPASDAPINYIGTVVNTNSSSTLNPNDQINGGNAADELTVNMDRSWIGFNDGFVKDVPTVNLNNETASGRNLNFNAENIEGVDTWNVNGNVSLSNLEKAGITVNLSNVNGDNPYNLNFDADAVKGGNDSLTLGINNMPEYVTVNGNGIEHVTVNSTGDVENYVWLKGMDGAKSVKIIGDGEANVALSPTVTTIDATEAGADTFVCTRYSDLVESIRMGNGDDSFTLRSITPNAVVDGGDGQDTGKLYNTSGAYQLQMSNVETLNITVGKNYADQATPDPSAALALDGGLTTGLETLGLTGGNGYALNGDPAPARSISLSNYDMGELTVAVTKKNNVDLNITDIEDITVNVGDGKATDLANNVPLDQLTGTVTLPDAQNVAINITDLNNPGNAQTEFNAALVAGKAGSLSLTSGQNAGIQVQGGDLSAVSQLTISGYYDTTIQGANLSQDAKSVYVDAQGQIGGIVTTSFTGNETKGGATLNYDGSTTGENILTVDNTYSAINVVTGINNDTLTLTAVAGSGGKSNLNSDSLVGNLGAGTNTVNVSGNQVALAGADFSSLQNVSVFNFTDLTSISDLAGVKFAGDTTASEFIAAGGVINFGPLPTTITFEDSTTPTIQVANSAIVMDVTGDNGGIVTGNGTNIVTGTINTTGEVTIAAATAGALNTTFGTDESTSLVALKAGGNGLAINGESGVDEISGSIGSGTAFAGKLTINTGTGADKVNLTNVNTGTNDVSITTAATAAEFNVAVAGAGAVTLSGASTTGIDVDVAGATGAISVTNSSADKGGTIDITTPGTDKAVTIVGSDGNSTVADEVTLNAFGAYTGALSATKLDDANDTLTFKDTNDLSGATFTTDAAKISIADGGNLTLAADGYDHTFDGVGTLKIAADVTAGDSTVIQTATLDIADGKTFTLDAKLANLGVNANAVDITGTGTLKVDSDATDAATAFNLTGIKSSTAEINVVLDYAADTVVLGAGAETVTMGASGLTVSGFDSASDSIAFTGDYSGFDGADYASDPASAGTEVVTDATGGNAGSSDYKYSANVLEDGKLYKLEAFSAADDSGDIVSLFTSDSASDADSGAAPTFSAMSDKFYLATGEKILLITEDSGNSYLWYIENDSTEGLDSNDTITLIGTLDSATLDASNFVSPA